MAHAESPSRYDILAGFIPERDVILRAKKQLFPREVWALDETPYDEWSSVAYALLKINVPQAQEHSILYTIAQARQNGVLSHLYFHSNDMENIHRVLILSVRPLSGKKNPDGGLEFFVRLEQENEGV